MKTIVNPFDPENIEITKKVKEWMYAKFLISNEIEINVTQISCADGCCPNAQTKILVHTQPTTEYVIGKPLTLVRKWDISLLK